jgi:drug/metabolite transporter superfamily protein YnfA
VIILALFWTMTLVGCGYAAAAGGRDGRWAALLILSASLLSIPAILLGRHWHRIELGVMVVDAMLMAGLFLLSMRTARFFPLWMAGFQLIAVTTHLATMLAPDFTPRVYRALEGVWAVPMTMAMIFGIMLDRRMERLPARVSSEGDVSPH